MIRRGERSLSAAAPATPWSDKLVRVSPRRRRRRGRRRGRVLGRAAAQGQRRGLVVARRRPRAPPRRDRGLVGGRPALAPRPHAGPVAVVGAAPRPAPVGDASRTARRSRPRPAQPRARPPRVWPLARRGFGGSAASAASRAARAAASRAGRSASSAAASPPPAGLVFHPPSPALGRRFFCGSVPAAAVHGAPVGGGSHQEPTQVGARAAFRQRGVLGTTDGNGALRRARPDGASRYARRRPAYFELARRWTQGFTTSPASRFPAAAAAS